MNASFSRRQLLLAMLATPLVLSACGDKAPKQPAFRNLEGVDMSSADVAKDFSLLDTEGQRRTMADYRGRIVLRVCGFTRCPGLCPRALTRGVGSKDQVGEDGDKLQVLCISIAPERDTLELLRASMQAFDPGFVAQGATEEEL